MERLRAVQMTLLEEIDQVCRDHNIPYILTRCTAYAALTRHELPEQKSVPTIAMTYEDACKIRTLLNLPAREFEDSLQNRNIDRTVLRYSDSSTFFWSAEELGSFRLRGVGVDIELIRGIPKQHLMARLLTALDAVGVISARLRNTAKWSKPLWKILGVLESALFRRIYWADRLSRQSELRISRFPRKSINFSRAFLMERKEISVRGHSFFIPKDSDGFMKIEYGFDWEKRSLQQEQSDLHLSVWDCDVSYSTLSSVPDSKLQMQWVRWFWLKARIRRLRGEIEGYWNVLLYTEERFAMARLYVPQKEKLLQRYASGGIAAVTTQLQGYLDAIERQMSNGLGLYFDEALFDLALEALAVQHGTGYAERVKAAVPSVFYHHTIVEEKRDD